MDTPILDATYSLDRVRCTFRSTVLESANRIHYLGSDHRRNITSLSSWPARARPRTAVGTDAVKA